MFKHFSQIHSNPRSFLQFYFKSLYNVLPYSEGRNSSVGIATRYVLDRPGIESRCGEIFRTRPTGPGAHPTFYTMGTGCLS